MAFHKTPAHKTPARAPRHDGWTPERQLGFFERLSRTGNVRVACAAVGLSRAAAYRQRHRDATFDRRWSIALGLARDVGIQALSERALEGVEEPVYYRGKLVGSRRRYDNRLLLAHLARLDKLVDQEAFEDAFANYEDPFACLAGERAPEALGDEAPGPAGTPALEWVPGPVSAAAPVQPMGVAEASARGGDFFPRTMSPLSTSPLAPALAAAGIATQPPKPPRRKR